MSREETLRIMHDNARLHHDYAAMNKLALEINTFMLEEHLRNLDREKRQKHESS